MGKKSRKRHGKRADSAASYRAQFGRQPHGRAEIELRKKVDHAELWARRRKEEELVERDNFDEYMNLAVRETRGVGSTPECLRAMERCATERWPLMRKYWPRLRRRICSSCGESVKLSEPRLLVCGGCSTGRGVGRYCSEACQREHWPVHKTKCAFIHCAPATLQSPMYGMEQTELLEALGGLHAGEIGEAAAESPEIRASIDALEKTPSRSAAPRRSPSVTKQSLATYYLGS